MKVHFIIAVLMFLVIPSLSQIDKINDKANKNQEEQHSTERRSNSVGATHNNPGEGCLSALTGECMAIACGACFDLTTALLLHHHDSLKRRMNTEPFLKSIDLMLHGGYSINMGTYSVLPRIRGTYGLFSTDFRFNSLIEYNANKIEDYTIFEWQILQLNFVPVRAFNFRIGAGMLYEQYTGKIYNENMIALGFQLLKSQMLIDLEGRACWDYDSGNSVFQEVNLRLSQRIIKVGGTYIYAALGGVYQRYYPNIDIEGTTDFFIVQGGFTINFHSRSIR